MEGLLRLSRLQEAAAQVQRLWVSFEYESGSRCCIRIGSAMIGVPHRPLLPSLPAAFRQSQQQLPGATDFERTNRLKFGIG